MKTAMALRLAPLMLVTAFSMGARPEAPARSAFRAEISGDVSARPSGAARFGVSGGTENVPAVFTISLGANDAEGSVLFTRRSGERLTPGAYRVSDQESDGGETIRALVMTGSATAPTGVFQGTSGTLVITGASEREIRGSFRIDARGFLAAQPEVEDRPIKVSGEFTASR
jgi:hypothetical protein